MRKQNKHVLNLYLPNETWVILLKMKGENKIKTANSYILDLIDKDLKEREDSWEN